MVSGRLRKNYDVHRGGLTAICICDFEALKICDQRLIRHTLVMIQIHKTMASNHHPGVLSLSKMIDATIYSGFSDYVSMLERGREGDIHAKLEIEVARAVTRGIEFGSVEQSSDICRGHQGG